MQDVSRSIAFFGHNAKDAAVRRRAVAMQRAGFTVTGFMPHRGDVTAVPFEWIDLGLTHDNDYVQRVKSIFTGAKIALDHSEILRSSDLFYARNLDMLAMALRVRKRLKVKTPVVYECLDVHHKLVGSSVSARALRQIEKRLVRASDLVVVSSPRFEKEHFRRYYKGQYRHMLIENRLIEGDAFGARPDHAQRVDIKPLKIGWFGNLRCRRSFELMKTLARHFPKDVHIELRGYPALSVISDIDAEISEIPNITYHGRYKAPEELGEIYGGVDVVWAGDWYEAGFNSIWLLPNRIYEGGYFGVPALAPAGTQTASWLEQHGIGSLVPSPPEQHLIPIVETLLRDPSRLAALRQSLRSTPVSIFVEPADVMRTMVKRALTL